MQNSKSQIFFQEIIKDIIMILVAHCYLVLNNTQTSFRTNALSVLELYVHKVVWFSP